MTLKDSSAAERRSWSRRVLNDLEAQLGKFGGHTFEVHAGKEYCEYGLVQGLRRAGAQVERPTEGLPIGKQLQLYAQPPPALGPSTQPAAGGSASSGRRGPIERAVRRILRKPGSDRRSDRSDVHREPPGQKPVPGWPAPSQPAGAAASGGHRHAKRGSSAPVGRVDAPTGKYRPLYDALAGSGLDEQQLSFARIEELLGFPLPASARRHQAWWANETGTHSHARAWLAAGYRTRDLNLTAERVRFIRDSAG